MPIPTLTEGAELMRHHWDADRYPKLVYVETTNFCNAHCEFCLYDKMERPVEFMDGPTFRLIADKVKARGLKVGAMFCFGEPLADADIFDKIRYARRIGVMPGYIGLNTNASLLTPEKYDGILSTCGNITLSFPNTGDVFDKMTGLSWVKCYQNAVDFIRHRDKVKPGFKIEIGCNDVTGHDRGRVQMAFAAFNVAWARDAEIHWGSKVITGVIDRSIMYHNWACDGYKGAMQVKPNGDCCFCAYDVVRNETVFANILTDDWATIERNFKARWREPSSLCLRCDFWNNYHQMKAGGWKRGPHVDDSWQVAYGESMASYWEDNHANQEIRYLTNSALQSPLKFLELTDTDIDGGQVLNIGVGTGRCTRDIRTYANRVDALDISQHAIDHVSDVVANGFTDPEHLPSNTYDMTLCHLVVQHMADVDLYQLLRHAIRSLKPDGVLAVQYAAPPGDEVYAEDLERQRQGVVRRTPEHFERMVVGMGGQIVHRVEPRYHSTATATDDNVWHGCHIRRAGQ